MDNVLYRKAFEKDDPAEEKRPDIVCTGECNGYAVFYSDDELGTDPLHQHSVAHYEIDLRTGISVLVGQDEH